MKYILLLTVFFLNSCLYGQIISRFAGNGMYGTSGDGAPAVTVQLTFPDGITYDDNGNVYFSEPGSSRIRMVDVAGIIHTFAGTGAQGYSGDGGPALSATLNGPECLIRDKLGNLYFTDQDKAVIRKINTAGIITTITGNLPLGYSGDGGLLIQARFNKITGICFDDVDNLYIADGQNNVIRKVNSAGRITTIAGTGTPGFSGDGGLATAAQLNQTTSVVADHAGNIFVGDFNNHRVRKISSAGIITSYVGNGSSGYPGDGLPAINSSIEEPLDLAVDNADNLYVTDRINKAVRKINTSGIITTFAGNGNAGYSGDGGPPNAAAIDEPYRCQFDNFGNAYLSCNYIYHVIRKVTGCVATITSTSSSQSLCVNNNTAFSINASGATGYQWQNNSGSGWNDLTNGPIYSGVNSNTLNVIGASLLMNGYQFRCKVTNGCGDIFTLPNTLMVSAPSAASLTITTLTASVCSGATTVFNAVPTNGGSAPLYQWMKNGINVGNNISTYIDNNLLSGDIVSCKLISNSTCITVTTATSNPIVIILNPTPANFLGGDTALCSYSTVVLNAKQTYQNYLWNNNSTTTSFDVKQPGLYWLEVTDMNGCKGRDSVNVYPKDCVNGFYVPTAFVPASNSGNNVFKPSLFGTVKKFNFIVFNMYGQVVFRSEDPMKGWDGIYKGMQQDGKAFVWICSYQFEGQPEEVEKGSVVLVK